MQSGPPPWTPGLDQLTPRLDAIGLQQLGAEGEVIHIHQHLDVWFDGKKVQVPADIGINQTYGYLTELHTHDTSGVMHVESPTKRNFTLGEFFAVWGVRLTSDCLGSTCNGGGKQVRVYVDGKQLTTPPDDLVLKAHQEIAVTYGTAAQLPHPVPASYKFPAGL